MGLGTCILILSYTLFKLLDNSSLIFAFISYVLFAVSFIYSIICFSKIWWLSIIQIITLFVAINLPQYIRTEVNFYLYKEDREEIIRMLESGELKKEADRYGNKGYKWYYTPLQYMDAVKSQMIMATKYSEDRLYVFFQSAEQPLLDFRGLQEGFIYSSTGQYPTAQEFNYSHYEYKKIDEHWYFVSDDSERFKKSCLLLCN